MVLCGGARRKPLGFAMRVLVHELSNEVRIRRLATPSAKVGPSASLRAIFSVSAASCSLGTIQLRMWLSLASCAVKRSPKSAISSAFRSPTMRGRK